MRLKWSKRAFQLCQSVTAVRPFRNLVYLTAWETAKQSSDTTGELYQHPTLKQLHLDDDDNEDVVKQSSAPLDLQPTNSFRSSEDPTELEIEEEDG